MTDDSRSAQDRQSAAADTAESEDNLPPGFLNVSLVLGSLVRDMNWHDRGLIGIALLSALFYSAGTASLPLLIKLPTVPYHTFGSVTVPHAVVIGFLTLLFLLRPIFFRTHVRMISKTLKRQVDIERPFGVSIGHQTLLILTRDVPLLLLLGGALAVNLGLWTFLAGGVIFIGIYLAVWNVKRHRSKRAKKPLKNRKRDYLSARNARADTEAISDLPQSLLVAGIILWSGWTGVALTGGVIASLVLNIMLASPPIKRLTRLYTKVSLQRRGFDDDED